MPIIQETKFKRKDYDKTAEVIGLKINDEYRDLIDRCKDALEQPKDATVIKQLMQIGAKVVLDEKIAHIMSIVFENKRKNKRLGIIEFEA